jgi:hypothetical protein
MPEGADTAVQFFGTGDLAFVAGSDPAAVRPFDLGASDADLLAAARTPDADASLVAAVDAAHALCVATAPAAAAAGEEASSSDSDSDDAAAAANGDDDEALLLGELAGANGEAKKAKKEKKDKKDKKEKKERKKEKKARKEEKEEKERRDKESRRSSGKNATTSSSSSSSAAAHSSSSIRRQRSEVLAGRVALTTEQLAEAGHIIDAAILGSPATADAIVMAELRKLAAAAPPTGAQLIASDCGSALGALLNPALSSRAPGGAAVLAPATVVLAEAVLRFWYAAGLTTKERHQLDRARPIADFGVDDVVVLS